MKAVEFIHFACTSDDINNLSHALMLKHARELGASAIIGVRYDATEIGPGVTEVLAYGSAVKIDPPT